MARRLTFVLTTDDRRLLAKLRRAHVEVRRSLAARPDGEDD